MCRRRMATRRLQQPLPFTVLKPYLYDRLELQRTIIVATALTVYGIETEYNNFLRLGNYRLQQPLPFTVLKRF